MSNLSNDHAFLGVCGYLSEQTGIESRMFRLAFVVTFFLGGSALFVYFLIYFLVLYEII